MINYDIGGKFFIKDKTVKKNRGGFLRKNLKNGRSYTKRTRMKDKLNNLVKAGNFAKKGGADLNTNYINSILPTLATL